MVPVIVGPTAGGKSALAVALAHKLARRGLGPGEVVTADAFQVYRGLDIASAKPTPAERDGVPHHLIDVVEPTDRFTVAQWLALAERACADIADRGGVPIVVGGTHLYAQAYLYGLFEGPQPDEAVREQIRAMDPAARRAELASVDPAAAARIDPNDQRRTVRALEIFRQTGTPISALQQQWDRDRTLRPGVRVIGLEWPAEAINRRINQRVRTMMEAGLLAETRGLWEGGRLGPQAREALGIKQLIGYLEGRCSSEDAVERIKIETRRFGKNQRTWLKRFRAVPGAIWLEALDRSAAELAADAADALFGTGAG